MNLCDYNELPVRRRSRHVDLYDYRSVSAQRPSDLDRLDDLYEQVAGLPRFGLRLESPWNAPMVKVIVKPPDDVRHLAKVLNGRSFIEPARVVGGFTLPFGEITGADDTFPHVYLAELGPSWLIKHQFAHAVDTVLLTARDQWESRARYAERDGRSWWRR